MEVLRWCMYGYWTLYLMERPAHALGYKESVACAQAREKQLAEIKNRAQVPCKVCNLEILLHNP